MCVTIPPHLKCVATLPCEIRMSENWRQSEICIVINDQSDSAVNLPQKYLSCDGLLFDLLVKKIKIGEYLAKLGLQEKWLIVSYTPFALDVCPQRCRTRLISKITCV